MPSQGSFATVKRAAITVAFALTPFLGLAGCSDQGTGKTSDPIEQVAGGAGAPSIDGPILITPGLWRTTTTIEGRAVLGAHLECVNEASQKASGLTGTAEAGCAKPTQRSILGGYAYDLVCEQGGLTTTVAGEVKGDAKRVTMSSTTSVTGPEGEVMPPSHVVIENVYVGPCPSDMKPGDSVQAP